MVLQTVLVTSQGQTQPQPQKQPRKKTRFAPDVVVRALDFAETETSPPKAWESGAQGGPANKSSDLNDNNESLNQARGSSLNLGGVDHAGKKQMHPSDLLNVKRIASVSQHEDGRLLLGDMVNQIVAERLQFQELTAARERANQLQLRDIQRKSQREAFVSMFRGVPGQLAAGAAHDLNNSNFCLDYVVLKTRTMVLVYRGNRTLRIQFPLMLNLFDV